jgi:hypothetical protein
MNSVKETVIYRGVPSLSGRTPWLEIGGKNRSYIGISRPSCGIEVNGRQLTDPSEKEKMK